MLRIFFIFWLVVGMTTTTYSQFNRQAHWISTMESQSATNTWLGYRKTFTLDRVPGAAEARIAVDIDTVRYI